MEDSTISELTARVERLENALRRVYLAPWTDALKYRDDFIAIVGNDHNGSK